MSNEVAHREPSQAQAKAAFDKSERIKQHIRDLRGKYVDLAADLYDFHQLEQWRDLNCPSFSAYLADPEVALDPRYAHYLVDIWSTLVIKRGVDPERLKRLEVSKVQDVLPAIRRDHVDVDDALSDAEVLGRGDLRQSYSLSSFAGTGDNGRGFDATLEPEWTVCEACGSRVKVRTT